MDCTLAGEKEWKENLDSHIAQHCTLYSTLYKRVGWREGLSSTRQRGGEGEGDSHAYPIIGKCK